MGKNGYRNSQKNNMVPLIEAFCFMTIFEDLKTDEYKVLSDFQDNVKKVNQQVTDKVGDQKLDYCRETMYQLMGQSDKLKKLLLDSYNNKNKILNFGLTQK